MEEVQLIGVPRHGFLEIRVMSYETFLALKKGCALN